MTGKNNNVAITEFLEGYAKLNNIFKTHGTTFEKLTLSKTKPPKLLDSKTSESIKKTYDRLSSFSELINQNRGLFNSLSNSDSSKFWKKYSSSLKETVQNSEKTQEIDSETSKKIVKELDSASKKFDTAEKSFIEETEIDDASARIQDYNRTMAEVGLTSKYLTTMATDFSDLYNDGADKSILDKIKEKLSHLWNRITKSISTIIDRMKEYVFDLGDDIKSHLSELQKSLSGKIDFAKKKITEIFEKISEKFHNMIEILLQKMFEFLSRFSSIAKDHGYGVTKIQVKLPSIKLEPHGLFPIPIPTIDPPDITVDISALSKTK